jgi:deoxyribonuclease V
MSEAALHDWNVSMEEAVAIQQRLRHLVQRSPTLALDAVRTVAGIDVSYKDVSRAAAVVLALPSLEVIEQAEAIRETTFPYVPGLLSFREVPAVLDVLTKLTVLPDVLMCDGQGYAHPRRLGLASHLGVYLGRPAVGCAKSRLIGRYEVPGPNIGDRSPLVDRGEVIGAVLRTKPGTNPLFVSVGHLLDLDTAVELVLRCLCGYRLPEPTRLADKLTKRREGTQ